MIYHSNFGMTYVPTKTALFCCIFSVFCHFNDDVQNVWHNWEE